MADIRCWNCEGAGKFVRVNGVNDAEAACFLCNGTGTIPDRRRPAANDRAVERIKRALVDDYKTRCAVGSEFCRGYDAAAKVAEDIIREEAERHE